MKIKYILPLALCSIFAFATCFTVGAVSASADALVGAQEEDYISINPFNGGVVSFYADSDFVSCDIPLTTYSYVNIASPNYQYWLDDYVYLTNDGDIGRFALTPNEGVYDYTDFNISFYNKVFAPNWFSRRADDGTRVYDNTYPCIVFHGLDNLVVNLSATFLIPNSKYTDDLPDGDFPVGNPNRYVNIDTFFNARYLTGVDYYSSALCLPLSDIFGSIVDDYPYLISRQNSLYATDFVLSFDEAPSTIVFCNSGSNGDTALFPYFDTYPHAYGYLMEDFLATDDVVFVELSPVEQLLAVPKSFLDTEFIPGFSFGNLILIAIGVIIFGFVMKVFLGG